MTNDSTAIPGVHTVRSSDTSFLHKTWPRFTKPFAQLLCLAATFGCIFVPVWADDFDDLKALSDKAERLKIIGKLNEAESLATEVLDRCEARYKDQPTLLSFVILRLGEIYVNQYRFEEAETLFKRALAIDEALDAQHPDVARDLFYFTVLYLQQGRCKDAEPLIKRSLTIVEKTFGPNHPTVAATLNRMGQVVAGQGRLREAETIFKRALAIDETLLGVEDLNVSIDLKYLASCYNDQGRYGDAELLFRRALAIREKVFGLSHPDVARSLIDLAILQVNQANYDDAERLLKRSLGIAQKGPDKLLVSVVYDTLGCMYQRLGRYGEAEFLIKRSLTTVEKTLGPKHPDVALCINHLANLYLEQRRSTEAELLLRHALSINQMILGPEHPNLADGLYSLARHQSDQGCYADAEPLLKRSIGMIQSTQGRENLGVAALLLDLANQYLAQGRYRDAAPLITRSLLIAERTFGVKNPEVAPYLSAQAALYIHEGNFVEAESSEKRALELLQALDSEHPRIAGHLQSLAHVYFGQRRYSEAQPLLLRALEIQEKALGLDHAGVAISLGNLAALYLTKGDYEAAEPLVDRAIDIQNRGGVSERERYPTYKNRAELKWRQNRCTDAVADLYEAIRLAEGQRTKFAGDEQDRAVGFAQSGSAFETMVAWQSELNDVSAAFAAMERAQARSLIDQIAIARTNLLAGLPPRDADALRERDQAARTRVSSLERQLTILEGRRDLSVESRVATCKNLETELKAARDEAQEAYRAIRNVSPATRLAVGQDFAPISLDSLQTWLTDRQALLLRYFSGKNQLYLLVVSPGALPRLLSLSADDELAQCLDIDVGALTEANLQKLFTVSGQPLTHLLANPQTSGQGVPRLAALWKILIPESERTLLTAGQLQRVMIIPDGPLGQLPFESLVVDNDGAEPQFLLDVGPPIVYAPSATILYNLAERQAVPGPKDLKPVLTVGDPTYPGATAQVASTTASALDELTIRSRFTRHGGHLAQLPYTGTESKWVADNFTRAGTPTVKLLKDQATEAAVRINLPGRRIVHLACHGLVDQSYGNLFGSLALTPGKNSGTNPADDGFLTLAEIYELDLKSCELAVLSACETNYGPQQKGEGAWALSRGFLVAGAKRVVASNWLVDDEAAASLISYFCGGIANAEQKNVPVDYAEKLHAAKKWVRKQAKWKSPYYWGTFVLVGPN
jgi:CHAT domain-containing protein/tetratricopeptide (TPR) repeat protein